MKLYDSVDLNCELDYLAQIGVHKECRGRIIEQTPYRCTVIFFNPNYYGDYACAEVNKEYLTLVHTNNSRANAEFAEWLNKTDVRNKTKFNPMLFREYDKVELIAEKKKYAVQGVHKGMTGAITEPYSIGGCWNVIFTGSDGYDIAELEVNEEDIRLLQR